MSGLTQEKSNKKLSAEEKAAKKARKAAKKAAAGESETATPEKKKEKKEKKEKRKRTEENLDFFAPPSEDAGATKKRTKKAAGESDDDKYTATTPPERAAAPKNGREYRALHSITVKGVLGSLPEPILDWGSTPFPPNLVKPLAAAGFASPSPIQATCWPIMCTGRDCIAVAKTGSGKTLGFLLPAFMHLAAARPVQSRGDPPKVLVLAPTRELAVQIEDECVKFGKASAKVRSACCYGGAPKSQQIRTLQAGVDVLVATPGRLNDLLEMRRADVSKVSFLVFDEADRMLDMGFEPQIREVLKSCPTPEQGRATLFFTATWPKNVQALAATFLRDPVQINIGDTDTLTASKSITQHVRVLGHGSEKWPALQAELKALPAVHKTLVFSSTKRGCNEVADELWNAGGKVDTLHGDKLQWEREAVLNKFRRGDLNLVVCTDVAARGLDIDGVTHVINYDFPEGNGAVEDYVHRIGRTGRGDMTGDSITFLTPKEARHAAELVGIMEGAGQLVSPELRALAARGGKGKGGKGRGRFGGGKGRGKGGKGGGKGKGSGKGRW